MNRLFNTAFVSLSAVAITTAHSQVTAPPAASPHPTVEAAENPRACLGAVNDLHMIRLKDLNQAGASNDSASLAANIVYRKEMAAICVARFDIDSLDAIQLQPLAQLALYAQQFDRMNSALERYIEVVPADDQVKTIANVLFFYTSQFSNETLVNRFPQTIQLIRRIDTLADNPDVGSRIRAYGSMIPFAPELEKQRMIDSAMTSLHRLTPEQRKSAPFELIYMERAKIALRQGHESEIPALIDGVTAMLREKYDKPDVKSDLAGLMAFVGKRAPQLNVDYWLMSGADSGKVHDYRNKITIIETTSTTCGWCRRGYPILKRIASQYKGVVQPILLTALEGKQLDAPIPNAADELAAMHKYWVDEHKINFPIYVIDPPASGDAATAPKAIRGGNHPVLAGIGGIGLPKYLVIDGAGVIRYIQYGHSWTLEQDLLTLIHQLQPQLSAAQ